MQMFTKEERKAAIDHHHCCDHGKRHMRYSNSTDKWYCRMCEPNYGQLMVAARANAIARHQATLEGGKPLVNRRLDAMAPGTQLAEALAELGVNSK